MKNYIKKKKFDVKIKNDFNEMRQQELLDLKDLLLLVFIFRKLEN